MPLNAFIVRPFGRKSLFLKPGASIKHLATASSLVTLTPGTPATAEAPPRVEVDFDAVQQLLIEPALARIGIRGKTTSADIGAGNIREDMFNRLLTADLVLADVSMHNANVYYELGIRQAFRERHTFVLRCDLSDYPFDLQTDRYFAYDLEALHARPAREVERLVEALRTTIASSEPDSPVFRLLPTLESEDRGRFIAVPDEFREEVERARSRRQREVLSVLAIECEGTLWEVEGLRMVGRAQFESNFVDGARHTWEMIANRYPDDVEANTSLSTIYQRQGEPTRSQQALARVSRTKSLTVGRQSELRALEGRNLKEAWVAGWRARHRDGDNPPALSPRQRALLSPLLQLAADAYLDAFKLDLNNSYAGLNALTLLVIQTELALSHLPQWEAAQGRPGDGKRGLNDRLETIALLIPALKLAVESDRERLGRSGQVDPWFNLLESAVMCIVSTQPSYVERLFEKAVHFAPLNAGESMRRSLELYKELEIRGSDSERPELKAVGTIEQNVRRALTVLSKESGAGSQATSARRILLFVGMRIDGAGGESATPEADACEPGAGEAFPARQEGAVTQLIREAIRDELQSDGELALAIAAGSNGGDILFHEVLHKELTERAGRWKDKPPLVRLCLALPKPAYVGQYVAPAGGDWVERFSKIYRRILAQEDKDEKKSAHEARAMQIFTDSTDLPRWLHTRRHYNVGRRNNLWMLQHALTQAYALGEHTEITLIALLPATATRTPGADPAMGGVQDMMRRAAVQGVKVVPIRVPSPPVEGLPGKAAPGASAGARSRPGPAAVAEKASGAAVEAATASRADAGTAGAMAAAATAATAATSPEATAATVAPVAGPSAPAPAGAASAAASARPAVKAPEKAPAKATGATPASGERNAA